ncbi:hypothetical protein GDO81_029605 [Engystomops pustulosus]|uniref:Uncharacterized protein n=1 Tax=Engystomops pustulosus TaxID=76066 RepID=A0AAV6YIK4_ENGPU|nr:hypothetical protein GDO81_029605 [Engystomops pustulosus]
MPQKSPCGLPCGVCTPFPNGAAYKEARGSGADPPFTLDNWRDSRCCRFIRDCITVRESMSLIRGCRSWLRSHFLSLWIQYKS